MSDAPIVFEGAELSGVTRRPFRSRLVALLVWLAGMLGAFSLAAWLYASEDAPVRALLVTLLALLAGWAVPIEWKGDLVKVKGKLLVDGDGLSLDGELVARRRDIVRGAATSDGGGTFVLDRKRRGYSRWSGRVTIQLPDASEAQVLARALGTDLSSDVFAATVDSPLHTDWMWWAVVAAFVPGSIAAFWIAQTTHTPWLFLYPIFAPLVSPFALYVLGRPARLRIGRDGVEYRWAWRRRLLPYRSVVEMKVDEGRTQYAPFHPYRVTFELRDGGRVSWGWREGQVAVDRLRAAFQASRASDAPDAGPWLARNERPHEEWLHALRLLGLGVGRDYRTSPPSRDDLWRLVEDPSADVQLRAASAVALGGALDDVGRARLRVAAKVTLVPELRAVLEREAEADAGGAEEALLRLSRAEVA